MLSDLRHCGVRHDERPARAWQSMNTTMAPLDQIRQGSLGELKRRHDLSHRSLLRRKDGREKSNDERDDNNGRGKRDDDSDDDEEEVKQAGVRTNEEEDDHDDDKQPQQTPLPPPPPPPQIVSTMTVPGAAAAPTTVVVVSTLTAPPSVSTVWMTTSVTATPSTPSISPPPSNSALSTMSPAFSSPPESTLPPWESLPNIDDRPRKGLNTDDDRPFTSTTAMIMTATSTIWTSVVIPQTALASATVSALPDSDGHRLAEDHRKSEESGQLSDLAEHLLIAAGAIGAFIMVAAGIYFLHKMKRDPLASVRDRRFGKGGPRGWYGWRKQERGYMVDEPPHYYGQEYPSNEKAMSNQQHIERQSEVIYSPGGMPNMGNRASADALSRANSQRQEAIRQILLDTSVPYVPQSTHASPIVQAAGVSATQAFYNVGLQTTTLAREPSSAYSNTGTQNVPNSGLLADYNNTGNKNTLLSRQPGAENASLARQPSDAFDPNPREVNHMSYMSSLSSGFGDGLIMPEPTVNGGASRQTYRQSRNPGVSRFSWSTAAPQTPGMKGDRDTMYTATSTDSAPRFRTVNSWVAHQAGRVDKNGQSVPSMPPLPLSLQTTGASDHQRKPSEDPAFRYHPGDEIEIAKGARVPSAILDTKTNVN